MSKPDLVDKIVLIVMIGITAILYAWLLISAIKGS